MDPLPAGGVLGVVVGGVVVLVMVTVEVVEPAGAFGVVSVFDAAGTTSVSGLP